MSRIWQTILFFTLVSAMIAFIFSALHPSQYLAESKFLVISDSIHSDCNKELGDTLANVILSESFQGDVQGLEDGNKSLVNLNQRIKVKNSKGSNVVNVTVGGGSLLNVQSTLEGIQGALLSQAYKYYSPEDKIRIKTLINPRIVKTPRIILENTIKGLIVGTVLGLIVVLLTGLRLDLFKRKGNAEKKQGKKKIKRQGGASSKFNEERDYKKIVKKRLEKELSKEPNRELDLTEEEYVFPASSEVILGQKKKINKGKKIVDRQVIKEKEQEATPEVRVISASMMTIADKDKKVRKDTAPENLPVFIEEKLPVEDEIEKSQKSEQRIKEKVAEEEISKKDEKLVDEKYKEERDIYSNKTMDKKVPSVKKANAHDIANGFAPSKQEDDGPTNEEIKDRLNKLLRGEL